ncbi:YdcF family protein [Nocardiopsis sp. EMB25]|uniref:YdcF family protein n=1 Tax=Nocardiopsis sp. EMB25 TaxID=2835867 RepID=UPI0022841B42|nr:YdcF family protein [Nocardiopsis sp. EMB25]MCY9782555.1 YdcF family protein [Nocardiopsis sp. EMB25]
MADDARPVTQEQWRYAELIWEYHRMHHRVRSCDVAIALGCNDIGVAAHTAELYHTGLFPTLVFTGANSPSTAEVFPRGEAVHFRERALELGVPDPVILVEPEASNTGQNVTFSRRVLAEHGIAPTTVLLVCMPYMERRAFATTRKLWPEVEVVCASAPLSLGDYVKEIGDAGLVIDMMVGDLQRVMEYPKLGFAIDQDVPGPVREAYEYLVASGFDSRLIQG